MIKSFAAGAIALGLVVSPATAVFAAAPAPAVQDEKLTVDSTLRELMENEATAAIIAEHMPVISDAWDQGMVQDLGADAFPLSEIATYPEAMITDEQLDAVSDALAAL